MKYAEIILPLPLANSYTYSIPSGMEKAVQPGCRVIVHFGKRKYYTGIISEIHDRNPQEGFEIKQIHALLDTAPVLRRPQLRFWSWISSYYLCKLGDVYKSALPSGLKLESETMNSLNKSFIADTPLRPNEQAVLDAFDKDQNKLTISQLEKKTRLRNVVQLLASLMSRGAVVISEQLKKGFMPKSELFVELNPVYRQEDLLQQIFDELKRAKKQEYLLVTYLELSHALNPVLFKEISKKELLDYSQCSSSILDQLVKRGILHYKEKEIGRLKHAVSRIREPEQLSEAQLKAYDEIYDRFKTKDVCLLHGVTSSGKTELYIHLIRDVLAQGRQVLYLLPEIAITTQITERLSKYFGDKLFVYHSKFPDNERVEIWNRLLYSNEPLVVLGVRSSLFLPFKDLGLIIVDEEHENTYKQQDPAPRYHARSAAIVLAGMHGGKTLLGSATPSVDSYFNAQTGKYGWVELTTRYGDGLLPETMIVDIKELRRKKIMKEGPFSPVLLEKMKSAVSRHEQVILFQNRRGFASIIECRNCGWVPHCVNCDVSLTYHKSKNELICHYCGYNILLPPCCPECQHKELKLLGFGTQKIEEEITTTFPEFTTGRLDIDTARTRSSYERIIADFEKGDRKSVV